MSRLHGYLTEETYDEVIEMLQRDCMPYLKESKIWHKRSIIGDTRNEQIRDGKVLKLKSRKNRIPTDTPQLLHDKVDGWLKSKFGWKVRSEGVFTTPLINLSFHIPVFFPIGPYKFVYSNKVSDMYMKLFDMAIDLYGIPDKMEVFKEIGEEPDKAEEIFKEFLKYYGNTFTDKKLNSVNPAFEVIFKCKEYYLVNTNTFTDKKIKTPNDILKI